VRWDRGRPPREPYLPGAPGWLARPPHALRLREAEAMVGRRLALRPGLSLVEAIVALTLLAIGLLGALATQLLSARLLREAEARAGAINLAGAILDSLHAVPAPTAGERYEAGYLVRWSVMAGDGSALIGVR